MPIRAYPGEKKNPTEKEQRFEQLPAAQGSRPDADCYHRITPDFGETSL